MNNGARLRSPAETFHDGAFDAPRRVQDYCACQLVRKRRQPERGRLEVEQRRQDLHDACRKADVRLSCICSATCLCINRCGLPAARSSAMGTHAQQCATAAHVAARSARLAVCCQASSKVQDCRRGVTGQPQRLCALSQDAEARQGAHRQLHACLGPGTGSSVCSAPGPRACRLRWRPRRRLARPQ